MSLPVPTSEPNPPRPNLADVFPLPAQAALFVLLIAFLGFVGWKSWQPPRETHVAGISKIDLNVAEASELELLRGVGPELAERIIDYRDKHGPFESLNDLRKISGIGPAKLEQIRSQVMLSWPATQAKENKDTSHVVLRPASHESKADAPLIDPNRASLAELQTLPGIGPKLAQRIVDQRTAKAFVELTDLRRVPGIGPKTLEKIRPRLHIGGEQSAKAN